MASSDGENKHEFTKPVKKVSSLALLDAWKKSKAYHEVVGYITMLNERVKGKDLTVARDISHNSQLILEKLVLMKQWIGSIPPVQQPMRFGNKAFRIWHARLVESTTDFHLSLLPAEFRGATVELDLYFQESFGNLQRIDYGTGHELCFLAWLCCLRKLGVLTQTDDVACVMDIFNTYIDLMRTLQKTYWLEPAGSKGVWGLDDYQFVPFIFGASQLVGHPSISPGDITQQSVIRNSVDKFIYFQCIDFVCQMKTGPFGEHSPLLHDISGVATWKKVNGGLIKMYKAEVLHKFPVVQHFFFGSLLSFDPAPMPTRRAPPRVTSTPQPTV